MMSCVRVSEKAQEASFLVAELTVKSKKPHNIAESLILPACKKIVGVMIGEDAVKETDKIPLSDNMIKCHIDEMAADIETQLTEKLNKTRKFALQIDDSTDCSRDCHLLASVLYTDGELIMENFYFFLQRTTETFNRGRNLSQLGHITHCMLHREALVAKAMPPDLTVALKQAVKIVYYIKSRPLKSRLFTILCDEMESYSLSRGKALSRVYELRDELRQFSTEHDIPHKEQINDNSWWAKIAYLTDIFSHLNELNTKMQGKNENILTATDKLNGFKAKLKLWQKILKNKNTDMFPLTAEDPVHKTPERFEFYFPAANENFDWVRDPFIPLLSESAKMLSIKAQEELVGLCLDHSLKLKFGEMSSDEFWLHLAFSSLAYVKNKKKAAPVSGTRSTSCPILNLPPYQEAVLAKAGAYIPLKCPALSSMHI
uniref:Zinc finger BED domain-containing protein 5 n=1 Tax=Cyprinus carpio TaxID=7962 RepID=A0A8C2KNL6_CYPCA